MDPFHFNHLSGEQKRTLFLQVRERAGELMGITTSAAQSHNPIALDSIRLLEDPLSIMMAALVALRKEGPTSVIYTRQSLALEVADLFVVARVTEAFPYNPALALHMLAFATATVGVARESALALLAAESSANELGVVPNPQGFLNRLSQWAPGRTAEDLLGPVEPDIVGEAFLLGLHRSPLQQPLTTFLRAAQVNLSAVINVLVRTVQDFSSSEGHRPEPIQWLQTILHQTAAKDLSIAIQILNDLPLESVQLRSLRLTAAERVLHLIERRLEESNLSLVEVSQLRLQQAYFLSTLSFNQLHNGLSLQATASAQESVRRYRELTATNPHVAEGLARALNALSSAQEDCGQHAMALTTALEELQIKQVLAASNRFDLVVSLSYALNNVGARYIHLGRFVEGAEAIKEAITLKRKFVAVDRNRYLPDLTTSLSNLVLPLVRSEAHQEARAAAEEAVRYGREVVQRNRDAFLPRLALALSNQAMALEASGSQLAAIGVLQEVLGIQLEATRHNKNAFVLAVTPTLNNLSCFQRNAGLMSESLANALQAVNLCREAKDSRGESVDLLLCRYLANLGDTLLVMQRNEEALEALHEALALVVKQLENRASSGHGPLAVAIAESYIKTASIVGVWDGALMDRSMKLFASV